MDLHYNPCGARFCPVFWILFWMLLAGYDEANEGPVFRKTIGGRVPTGNGSFSLMHTLNRWYMECSVTFEGYVHVATLGYRYLKYNLEVMFLLLGIFTFVPHVIRHSGMKWGVRSFPEEFQIRNAARLSAKSRNFQRYIEDGYNERGVVRLQGGMDPIFFIWTAQPTSMRVKHASDLNVASV